MIKFYSLIIPILLLLVSNSYANTNYCTNGQLGAGWKLNESSGSALDCTTNSNTGSLNGSITQGATGYSGFSGHTSYSFPNSNSSYVTVSPATSINGLTNVSMGAWINPNSSGHSGNYCSGATIITKSDGSHGPELCIDSDGTIRFNAWWSGGAAKWHTSTTPVTFTGSWQHVAVTYSYSSTSNSPIFYYNGSALSTVTDSSAFGSQNSDLGNNINIGNELGSGGNGGFDGSIEEAFIANISFSSTDVTSIYTHGLDGSYGGGGGTGGSTIKNSVFYNATIN